MIALYVIRNTILSSGTGKLFDGRALHFSWDDFNHKVWIDAFDEAVQKKIVKDLTDAGLVQPNQIEMFKDYNSVVIAIPGLKDIEEIRELITDQLNNQHGINDDNFLAKLLFKGVMINSYRVDYRGSDVVIKISVCYLLNPQEPVELCFAVKKDKTKQKSIEPCFGVKKDKTKYDTSDEGYLKINGEQTSILLNLSSRELIHKHYRQYGTVPTEFVKWAIDPDKHLVVAATKHHLFVWNDECVDVSYGIVIPMTYYKDHRERYVEHIQEINSEQFTVRANGIHYTYNKRGELIATSA